ncbi:MAG TPA: pyridoxine 5'-phosphate synthase [Candidatus Polarisedimenticolia bacterium]|nr:pyridoxine 5'-phosphate synthase [Candidatus Polarisedimenticolia bacterium]
MRLGVNVDHIATLREARRADEPDPVVAAALAELAGADQITVHLRSDRRHIKERDLEVLRRTVRGRLNLEMAATEEMVKIAAVMKPACVTLVPERREEITTEGGLDVILNQNHLRRIVHALRESGLGVSVFVDPDFDQLKAITKIDAASIEINTGKYADAKTDDLRALELAKVVSAARGGAKLGMKVAAGHGLDYRNVQPIAAIVEVEELNIGHAIVARASLVGMERAVREMKALLPGRRSPHLA